MQLPKEFCFCDFEQMAIVECYAMPIYTFHYQENVPIKRKSSTFLGIVSFGIDFCN